MCSKNSNFEWPEKRGSLQSNFELLAMKIIINADDFGLTKPINSAIIELAKLGVISSTTVMVNMPYAEEVIDLTSINNLGIGLHLNLTEGRPMSDPAMVTSLINSDGFFYPVKEFKKRIWSGKILMTHMLCEISAQYEWLQKKTENRTDHFDSHQHINKFYFVSEALTRFAKTLKQKFGLRVYNKNYLEMEREKSQIINPGVKNIFHFGIKQPVIETILRFRNNRLKKTFLTTAGLLVGKSIKKHDLIRLLPQIDVFNLSNEVYEILCHPSTSLSELNNTNMLESRIKEYNSLKSPEFIRFCEKAKLINFSQISD